MFRLILLVLYFSLYSTAVWGQQGQVVKRSNGEPLEGATIYAIGQAKGVVSDQYGRFSLSLAAFPDTLVVSYLGYQQQLVPVTTAGEPLVIRLEKIAAILPDIVVQAYRKPEQISPEKYSVVDFLVVGEQLLLLIYDNRKPRYRLRITDLAGDIKQEVPLGNTPPESLFESCLGGLYVQYELSLQEVVHTPSRLALGKEYHISTYKNVLHPCLLADDHYYYTGFHELVGQIFTIYASTEYGKPDILTQVRDEDQIIRLLDENRFLQNKALSMTDRSDGPIRVTNMMSDEKVFASKFLYRPVNVQLIRHEDMLFVFDFVHHRISSFESDKLTALHEVPFILHKRHPLRAQILQDEITQKCYTFTRDNRYTYVYELDPHTGTLHEAAVIPSIYLKRVQIRGGTLYYLHKGVTFEDRWQYLYRVEV